MSSRPLHSSDPYDVVIIGCGMAGLAAGIRLAMFDKSVLILERHNVPGGLNSFYFKGGRKCDVGLHAVTNYVEPGVRGTPLVKLLRQLRIPRESFELSPQRCSWVRFPGKSLAFDNRIETLEDSVASSFPAEIDRFRALRQAILAFDEFDLSAKPVSAREIVSRHIRDPQLMDMLFCPLMYYGSSRENDMDFDQFVIMWKALFEEGFARPLTGVRVIIKALLDRYRAVGGKRKMKCGVRRIHVGENQAKSLELDSGETVSATQVISTIGWAETLRLCSDNDSSAGEENLGRLSFVETMTFLDRSPREFGCDETIVFFNDSERFHYQRPERDVDPRSGVICVPNNYRYPGGQDLDEGIFRVTALANYDYWTGLSDKAYADAKDQWYDRLQEQAVEYMPGMSLEALRSHTTFRDMFTPRTITYYTGHLQGAVYGSQNKNRTGETHVKNLYLAGTDQGFLGIIGAMLSGISMANRHVLYGG